jgi:hypothetical protein
MKKLKYQITDWVTVYNALADLIERIPERGNLRYIRHLVNLKIKLRECGNGEHVFTEKQKSSITIAMEERDETK